jgi:hypothetical protein
VADDGLAAPEPAGESDEVLHLRVRDRGDAERAEQELDPAPEPEREAAAVRRCIVVAKESVTAGWRVLWFVAAVAIPSRVDAAPAAPESAPASFTFQRSEMNAAPSPSVSASRTSSSRSRGERGAPASV